MGEERRRLSVVVNSSILIRYLAKEGYIRNFINSHIDDLILITPDYALYEIEEFLRDYEYRLMEKGVSRRVLEIALYMLMENVIVLPKFFYRDMVHKAYTIANKFDPKDTPFIALALKLNIPIWSIDRGLIVYGLVSGRYSVVDTYGLELLINGLDYSVVREELFRRYVKKS